MKLLISAATRAWQIAHSLCLWVLQPKLKTTSGRRNYLSLWPRCRASPCPLISGIKKHFYVLSHAPYLTRPIKLSINCIIRLLLMIMGSWRIPNGFMSNVIRGVSIRAHCVQFATLAVRKPDSVIILVIARRFVPGPRGLRLIFKESLTIRD